MILIRVTILDILGMQVGCYFKEISASADGGPRKLEPQLSPPLTIAEIFQRMCLGGVVKIFENWHPRGCNRVVAMAVES